MDIKSKVAAFILQTAQRLIPVSELGRNSLCFIKEWADEFG